MSQHPDTAHRDGAAVSLPRRPESSPQRSFPLVATLAPVIGSVVLWAVTRSPYVLVFALLGPIVAIAGLGDAALHGRRRLKKERVRFAAEIAAVRAAIVREHDRERVELAAAHRNLRTLAATARRDPERWRATLDSELPIVVGTGQRDSRVILNGGGPSGSGAGPDEFDEQLESLRRVATTLRGAPVVVDARLGIGLCGPQALAEAAARGIILQLAHALSPSTHEIVALACHEQDWLAGLPHVGTESGTSPARVVFRRRDAAVRGAGAETTVADRVVIAVAGSIEALPHDCRVALRIDSASAAVLLPQHRETGEGTVLPEFVSQEQARAFVGLLAAAADSAGLADAAAVLPDSVDFESLCPPIAGEGSEPAGASLACAPVLGVDGPVVLDLVRDGPHAIVGGTTGSGKSELLVAWVLAMAARHSPNVVNFLLVDFKGGSSFTAVRNLPHSVGLITDLDERSARRALTSLRAELRYRERTLADAGARSIEQLQPEHPLARLVVVVDEFAAMVQDFPELHELFADIAARGRSLGVHLILCTQRPAGVVRDSVLANCALRISLRVNNQADSTAVIGSAEAAELPRVPLGRALVCLPGEEPRAVQVALASDADSGMVASRWGRPSGGPAQELRRGDDGIHHGTFREPRRPWCEPLPARIPLDGLLGDAIEGGGSIDGDGLVFGLVDLPQEQRQDRARYGPQRHGSLMIVGGHRSGKSGMLATLLAADRVGATVMVPRDHEGAWDVLTSQLDAVRAADPVARLLLLDDLDALIGSYPEEYAHALVDTVAALLREGGRAGVHLVLTARRLGSSMQQVAALCDSRLVLRLPNKQEHVLAGGDAADFDPELQPGGGYWRGDRVQVAVVPASDARRPEHGADRTGTPDWSLWPGWIVVAAHPGELARRLRSDSGSEASSSRVAGLPGGWELVQPGVRPIADGAALSVGRPGEGRVFVADPETWQTQWSLFGSLRTTMPILFDGCGPAEFRALTRLRTLPPPITPSSGAAWLLTPEGVLERARPPWAADEA